MIEYLSEDAAIQQLNWGKCVENWLHFGSIDGVSVIRYLTLQSNKAGDGLTLSVWECEDIGNENYIDIYDFPDLCPDGDSVKFDFDSIGDAFAKVIELGGDTLKFTKQFGLQYVYQSIKAGA